jgi:hypothetical protein
MTYQRTGAVLPAGAGELDEEVRDRAAASGTGSASWSPARSAWPSEVATAVSDLLQMGYDVAEHAAEGDSTRSLWCDWRHKR